MNGWMNLKVMISSYALTLGCLIATSPALCLPLFFFKALVDEKTTPPRTYRNKLDEKNKYREWDK
jgi:hypothetical protein